ncbi:hypothetical protein JKA74_02430 [Marivirga sp. S37H4]|uniref:Lipocalin-like domain-containing protein n=1 Tax=Marivirga aurantiaca TaxID=2802615 RepID=A0A934WVV8_9BACT|nr:hypothetical protein [Marivirga aurantiaca]MBK6263880.1 hypothetical protein [Marivirga aurantiaca]
MKKKLTLLSYFVLAFALVFTACKPDDDVSPEQEKLNELNGTWEITQAVTPNETLPLTGVTVNYTAENSSFALTGIGTLNDNNLNHSEVITASGTISLNDNLDVMTLTPGGAINFTVSGTTLTLTYQSSFPKATDEEKSITLTATKQ